MQESEPPLGAGNAAWKGKVAIGSAIARTLPSGTTG